MARYSTRKGDGFVRLTIKGEATVQFASKIANGLRRALEQSDHLIIDANGVTDTDVSFFQLLCSAHCSSVSRGKSLTLECLPGSRPHEDARLLGLDLVSGCGEEAEAQCLWSSIQQAAGPSEETH